VDYWLGRDLGWLSSNCYVLPLLVVVFPLPELCVPSLLRGGCQDKELLVDSHAAGLFPLEAVCSSPLAELSPSYSSVLVVVLRGRNKGGHLMLFFSLADGSLHDRRAYL
jgi:hypothetical protein